MLIKANNLETKALELAIDEVLSEFEGSLLDAFNDLSAAKDGAIPDSICPTVDYEMYHANDLVEIILKIQTTILHTSKQLFEYAKNSIIQQTIDFQLDGDMNNLCFESLVTHGISLESTNGFK